jgi:hypothetical protein
MDAADKQYPAGSDPKGGPKSVNGITDLNYSTTEGHGGSKNVFSRRRRQMVSSSAFSVVASKNPS